MKQISKTTLLFITLVLFSCSKEDNPADAGMNVGVAGQMQNSSIQATILHAELLFDGKVIASYNSQAASALVSLSGGATSVSKGQHTVSFRIVNQTTSPSTYEVNIVRVEANNAAQNLFPGKKALANGESISVSVDL